ncbi:MAG: hypothetical protein Q9227_003554 [Pyrenula ochraceoflavens]
MKPSVQYSLRNILSKIHPPLDRTPRQKKQLLDLLDKSFQFQLDKYHPPFNNDSMPEERLDGKEQNDLWSTTDRHLQAVLKPLLIRHRSRPPSDTDQAVDPYIGENKDFELDILKLRVPQFLQEYTEQSYDTSITDCKGSGWSDPEKIVAQISAFAPSLRLRCLIYTPLMKRLLADLAENPTVMETCGWLTELAYGDLAQPVSKFSNTILMRLTFTMRLIIRESCMFALSQGKVDSFIKQQILPLGEVSGYPVGKSVEPTFNRWLFKRMLLLLFHNIYRGVVTQNGFPGPFPDSLLNLLIRYAHSCGGTYYRYGLLLYHQDCAKSFINPLCRFAKFSRLPLLHCFEDDGKHCGQLFLNHALQLCDDTGQADCLIQRFTRDLKLDPKTIRIPTWISPESPSRNHQSQKWWGEDTSGSISFIPT